MYRLDDIRITSDRAGLGEMEAFRAGETGDTDAAYGGCFRRGLTGQILPAGRSTAAQTRKAERTEIGSVVIERTAFRARLHNSIYRSRRDHP